MARHRHVDGTLVFVDVSGFTALSEKLAQRGKVGAEQLTDVLNTVFGTMLGLAAARGGTLLKFGGDALFLLFTGEGHAVQAASAAVEMRSALAQTAKTPSPAGRLRLRMSVGVHTGLVDLFLVGTSHRELVVVGPATTAVAELEAAASAGQILLGPQTAAALPAGAVGDPLGRGRLLRWRRSHAEHPAGHLRPDSEVDVARFVPTALREFLSTADPESEHRTVGVSFIRYTGMDALLEEHGHQAAADALHTMVTSAQGCCDAEGVTFLATDLAEDGGKIILVAGFPTTADDDQGRLLRASRRIVTDSVANDWPLSVRAGVNRGHVFAGAIGSFERATVTVMGDTVNLAARVMAKADAGTVLATPSTLDNAQTLFATEPVEPFMVKGKSRPVTAYLVGDETGTRPPRGLGSLPFLGRDTELATILDAIDALRGGTGGVITITGDVGLGKTRLLREALNARDTVPKVQARAEPYGASTPYRPLRDPLRHLLGLDHSVGGELSTWLSETVPLLVPDLAPWLPLVGDVLAIETPETDATRDLDPRFRPERTADALIRLIEALAGGPMILVVDDAHYADDATAFLLGQLERESARYPWLLLTTRRDQEGGFRAKAGHVVALGPLDDDSVRALVNQGTAAAPLRPHDVEAIVQRTAGNPLFVEETLSNLRQHGDIESLPTSLEGMVAAQIDGLSPLARRIVRRASVLGRSFRVVVLRDLFADEHVVLDDATFKALEDFLESDGKGRLRFRHALLRDAAYESLPFDRRRQFHRLAAASTLSRAGSRPEEYADNLALHYEKANDFASTWRWARVSAEQARRAFANEEAAAQFQRALAADQRARVATEDDLVEVLSALGEVLKLAGRFDDAARAFRDLQKRASAPETQLEAQSRRARLYTSTNRPSLALAEVTRGLRRTSGISDEAERSRLACELFVTRTLALAAQGRFVEARESALEAEASGRSANSPVTLATALNALEQVLQAMGRSAGGKYFEEALALLEPTGELALKAITTGNLGMSAFYAGDWTKAEHYYRRSIEIDGRTGDFTGAAVSKANLAELYVLQQRFDDAEALLAESLRTLRATGVRQMQDFAEILMARVQLGQGDPEGAIGLAQAVGDRMRADGSPGSAVEADVVVAEALLEQGQPGPPSSSSIERSIYQPKTGICFDRRFSVAAGERWLASGVSPTPLQP